MYVERNGTGAKAYFGLHGWSGDHRTFAPLAAHLPAHVSLYSADLPGCGSSRAPRNWNTEVISDEIAAAISAVARSHRQVTLIGNCSGALLGLLAAKKVSEQIHRLVLIDPFAYWPWYFRVFVAKSFGRYAYGATFTNPLGRWLTNQSLRRHRTSETDLTDSFGTVNHEVTYRYLVLLAEINGLETFKDLRMPVDIVYGEKSFGAVKKSVAMWRSIWPQARARMLEGAGHLPILEATEQLASIVFEREGVATTLAATGQRLNQTTGHWDTKGT